jgi:hypothetical protein
LIARILLCCVFLAGAPILVSGRRVLGSAEPATAAVSAQIGASGLVHTPDRTFLRPAQAGAYPIFWNAHDQFTPLSGSLQALSDRLSMPPEYTGLIVSDSETTFDGWAFLTTYRCARFHTGCAEIPDASPGQTP